MEDKEAEERIKNYAAKWFDKGREYGKAPITKDMLLELEREGEELLSELGYRKLPEGKPPLLTFHQRQKAMELGRKRHAGEPPIHSLWDYYADEVAQAQRSSDIEWYEGGE